MSSRLTSPLGRTLLLYGFSILLCLLILIKYLGLHRVSLRVPLQYSKDSLIHLNWIKNVVETGWYLHNDSLGAPGGQDLRGYPSADTLHHFTYRVMARFTHDVFLIGNLFYLLTFPLTTLTSLFVLRRLGIRESVAVVTGLLFTFLPYHYFRLEHLCLSAYYPIPLACLLAIRLYQGRPFLVGESESRPWLKRDWFAAGVVCLFLGFGGAYYAFFACWLFVAAAIGGAFLKQSWQPPIRGFALIVGTFLTFLLAVFPTLQQRLTEGVSADDVQRPASESEWYGLKVAQMLIPIQDHRVPLFRGYAKEYMSFMPLNNENSFSALGLVASLGLLILLGRITLQYRSTERGSALDGLALLCMAAILLGTVGGLGSSFAFFLSPWIRCYNRISIYIGFLALTAVAILLESAWTRWATTPLRCSFFLGVFAAILVGGLLDQTPRYRLPDYEPERSAFLSDREFVQRIEHSVPVGRIICQWPHRNYYVAHDLQLQLHSHSLRWTHGSLRGHEGDTWNRRLAGLSLEEQVATLCRAEAGGICIDTSAYPDRGASLIDRLTTLIGPPALTSPDGRCVFFDLSPCVGLFKQMYGEEEWANLRDLALNPPLLFWRRGFFEEEQGPLGAFRWASQDAELIVRNRSQRTTRVKLNLSFTYPGDGSGSVLRIESQLIGELVPLKTGTTQLDREVEIPPGEHVIRFTTDAKRQIAGQDMKRRPIVYMVFQARCDTILTLREEEDLCRDIARLGQPCLDH